LRCFRALLLVAAHDFFVGVGACNSAGQLLACFLVGASAGYFFDRGKLENLLRGANLFICLVGLCGKGLNGRGCFTWNISANLIRANC
jgi:hypothetical protein